MNYRFRVPHVAVGTGSARQGLKSDTDVDATSGEASKPSLQMRQGPSGQPVADEG